jgi:hypothetical protein
MPSAPRKRQTNDNARRASRIFVVVTDELSVGSIPIGTKRSRGIFRRICAAIAMTNVLTRSLEIDPL